MEENDTYTKLPTEEKCVHTLWKARLQGYEEAVKLFNQIDDEKAPEWNKYLGLIKKFVTDSNVIAQEKGMEAALVFIENCANAGKTAGEVMAGIVTKCLAAPKAKTKDLALQVTLMYVEIEKQEVVQEELMKGMDQKNPKVVSACVAAMTTALRQFGNKVIAIKPMVKKIPVLLSDRDKGVRDEMKALVIEMHRWIGPAIEPHIATLQAVMQQELRQAFSEGGTAQPTRFLRSQQHRVRHDADNGDGVTEDDDYESATGDTADIDPYSLLDPVEILSKLPKDFYTKLEATKWQERKEMLEALELLLKNAIKLEPGDYADLVRALKKIISKDKNVMLVAQSGNLLAAIARGLRAKFQPYAVACIQSILEKFKEKKTNVVTAMRDAADAIYPATNLEAIMEEMMAAFDNKNPSVKAEAALFLSRALCLTQPAAFNKKLLKAYVAGLMKLIESADPSVRDAAAEALGTATKLVGEKNIAPHIGKLDNLKEQKIKEAADKAVIQVKSVTTTKELKAKPSTGTGKGDGKPTAGSTQPKPVQKKPPAKKTSTATVKKASRVQASPAREQDLSPDEVEARAETFVPRDVMAGLCDGDWKTRLSSAQSFLSLVRGLSPEDATAQLLFKILNRTPGLKDTNVQVLKARLEVTKYVAENFNITTTAVDAVLTDIVTKLGEASCTNLCFDCLTALASACGLEHVATEALSFSMDSQKNPKVHAELFNWLANAVREFGFTLNLRSMVPHLKKALSANNPNVRTSAVNLIGVLSLYVGPSIVSQFDTEKPAIKQVISLEVDKYANSEAPAPIRGLGKVSKSASRNSIGDGIDEEDDIAEEKVAPAEDTKTRIDLAPLITDSLIAEIIDKNWKIRNEGLEKLKNMISGTLIKPSLGELPPVLTARILDSNSKLAQTALQICEMLATAMGPKCKGHARVFYPAFFQAFGDNKTYIRAAALSCADAWIAAGGVGGPFEGEMVAEALQQGSPVLRCTLLTWLANILGQAPPKSIPREELIATLPVLYACIEDRSADVRKAAADCVLPIMLHIGYEPMFKQMDKLKPASKTVIQAALDKARPNLPVQPLPTKAKKDEGKSVKTAGALKKEGEKKGASAPKGKVVRPSTANATRNKKEDEDFTPLLPNNNSKNQRIIDDQKLKVLKWNFTTPREEFFDLLKEQMTGAGLNKQLVANMFHSDFRYHLKAIESLSEDLSDNGSALIANLDLVLKWLTLRFYDTNPSVILKGLEYLTTVFNYLIDSDYNMPEYEATCFIPYLVIKMGDPKDAVRNGVKALLKQICVVYSVTKLFGYLTEGLKSKNARQRAECLECMGTLIETYGWSVLAGSGGTSNGGGALKELARHIGDRDNAVRSAALNCVAGAYFLLGEKVYKMIGQISDKDLSLLEERIKRASKSRSAEVRRSMVIPLSSSGRALQHTPEQEDVPKRVISVDAIPGCNEYDEEEIEEEIEPEYIPPPKPQEPKIITGPFGLDPDLIAQLDAQAPKLRKSQLPTPDLKFLEEPIAVPNVRGALKTATYRPATAPIPTAPSSMLPQPPILPQYQQHGHVDDTPLLETINAVASPDINVSIRALSLISGALVSGRGGAFGALEERLVTSISSQFRRLRLASPPGSAVSQETLDAYKYLASTLTALYETAGCGSHVGEAALGQLLCELLRVLAVGGAAGGDRLVRVLNNVCVRLLEHSHRTALLCAIITLLHDSIGRTDADYPRFQELLLKCFWKTLKMMTTWDGVEYDAVLYKIHLFYKAYPNSYWKRGEDISDTPYRTVKTLVHTLVKMRGAGITNYLTKIPDINESELYPYLLKVIKQLKLDDKKENTLDPLNGGAHITSHNASLSANRLPREVHEQLAGILKNLGDKQHNIEAMSQLYDLRENTLDPLNGGAHITSHNASLSANRLPREVHEQLAGILKNLGDKQHNIEAMSQLYDLRERHPDVDIWTYMQGSSFYFRNFVERGLKDVADQRRGLRTTHFFSREPARREVEISNDNEEKSHHVFLEKLRALQAKAGMKTDMLASSHARTPVTDNRMACDTINDNLPRSNTIDPQLELNTTHSTTNRSEKGVDALRLKLEQLKSAANR